MKVLLSILTAVIVMLAFGTVFADEMPATEQGAYYGAAFLKDVMMTGTKGSALGGVRDWEIDGSTIVFNSLLGTSDTDIVNLKHIKGVESAAPGGVRKEADNSAEIFRSLLGPGE